MFVDDSSVEELIKNLTDDKSEIEAKRYKRTLDSIVDSTVECLDDKIENILQNVTDKVRTLTDAITEFAINRTRSGVNFPIH